MSMAEASLQAERIRTGNRRAAGTAAHAAVACRTGRTRGCGSNAIVARWCRCTSSSALLAFTTLGPFVWRVDPASQDVDQVSQTPWADRTATVVAPYHTMGGRGDVNADAAASTAEALTLQLAEPANTQAVRLVWTADPQASGIPRSIATSCCPAPEHDLGLPLGEIVGSDQTRFEDRLDLDPMRYYYSVVAARRQRRGNGARIRRWPWT